MFLVAIEIREREEGVDGGGAEIRGRAGSLGFKIHARIYHVLYAI